MQKISNKKELKTIRKSLRNSSTSAEATLWTCLKKKQIAGLKFRRQHSIENYIPDFYCPQIKLAIELDGEPHGLLAKRTLDAERDEHLNNLGIKVLRFENRIVFQEPDEIINQIKLFKEMSDIR